MLLDEGKLVDLIGKRFEWGGRGPDSFDCYGLVREIHLRHGVEIPDYKSTKAGGEIIAMMLSATETEMWQPCPEKSGAVALIKLPKSMHVGILLPFGRMIHCWEGSNGVLIEKMSDWNRRVIGYYEFTSPTN